MIDEELWKHAHLELIHKALEYKWEQRKRARQSKNMLAEVEAYSKRKRTELIEKYANSRFKRYHYWLWGVRPND